MSNVSAGGLPAAGRRAPAQRVRRSTRRRSPGSSPATRTPSGDRGRIDFEDILLCTAALIAEHDEVAEPGPAHLPAPGRGRVPGRQPAAAGAARPVARGPRGHLRGRRPGADHPLLRRGPGRLPDRVRPAAPGRDRGPAGARLPLDPAGRRRAPTRCMAGRRGRQPTADGGDPAGAAARRTRPVASPRHRTRRPRRPAVADWLAALAAAGVSTTARWRCCSGSTPSHPRSSRRWPTADPVPGARRRAVLRAAGGAPGAAGAAHPGPGDDRASGRRGSRRRPGQGGARRARLDRRSRPKAPVRSGSAGSRSPRWSAWPRTWPASRRSRRRLDLRRRCRPSSTAAPRRSTCRPPRASRCRRCTRPRAWSGTRSPCSACTRARCRSCWPPRRRRSPRSAGCSTSVSPAPGAPADLLVAQPQRRRRHPQAVPVPRSGAARVVARAPRPPRAPRPRTKGIGAVGPLPHPAATR